MSIKYTPEMCMFVCFVCRVCVCYVCVFLYMCVCVCVISIIVIGTKRTLIFYSFAFWLLMSNLFRCILSRTPARSANAVVVVVVVVVVNAISSVDDLSIGVLSRVIELPLVQRNCVRVFVCVCVRARELISIIF